MASRKRNVILEEFIELYKSYPCLWQIKNKDYHDRIKKSTAYAGLVAILNKLDPKANKEDVVKKINNLRSNVRKEKKKYEESIKSGASADDIQKPSLWYYDLFDFLGDQETARNSLSNVDENNSEKNSMANTSQYVSENFAQNPTFQNSYWTPNVEQVPVTIPTTRDTDSTPNVEQARAPRSGKNKSEHDKLTNDVLISVRDHFKRPKLAVPQEDRFDLLGKTVAIRLRTIEKRQQLIAEKIINDTLFEAEMRNLNTQSYRNSSTIGNIQYQSSYCGYSSSRGYSPSTSPSPTLIVPSPTQSPSNVPNSSSIIQ